jgi:hypothetical protein
MVRGAAIVFVLGIAGALPAFAQYNLTLTGVGTGTVADGVYVSPYVGTIQGNGVSYTGYMICDDFNTESHLNQPWNANSTNAGALDGSEKFPQSIYFNGSTYTAQQAYDAAGWLANGLLSPTVLGNPTPQINYSFAIWDLLDGQSTDPAGGAGALEQQALTAVTNGYVASNVTVYTPTPVTSSQEFLVVRPAQAPELDPSYAMSALSFLAAGIAWVRGRR